MSEVQGKSIETLEEELKVLNEKVVQIEEEKQKTIEHSQKREETVGRQGQLIGEQKAKIKELEEALALAENKKKIEDLENKLESKKEAVNKPQEKAEEKPADFKTAEELMDELSPELLKVVQDTWESMSDEDAKEVEEAGEEGRAEFVKQIVGNVSPATPVGRGSFFKTKSKKQQELTGIERVRALFKQGATQVNTIPNNKLTGIPRIQNEDTKEEIAKKLAESDKQEHRASGSSLSSIINNYKT